jgi:hypothetical protein
MFMEITELGVFVLTAVKQKLKVALEEIGIGKL